MCFYYYDWLYLVNAGTALGGDLKRRETIFALKKPSSASDGDGRCEKTSTVRQHEISARGQHRSRGTWPADLA